MNEFIHLAEIRRTSHFLLLTHFCSLYSVLLSHPFRRRATRSTATRSSPRASAWRMRARRRWLTSPRLACDGVMVLVERRWVWLAVEEEEVL
jgi:hypothetical protein